MSLVNSFVNQIGREIGKDVYRGVKSSFKANITVADAFKQRVFSFKPSTYDKVTMRNLTQLVEDGEVEVSRKDFDIHDIYATIDDHIDNLKPFIDEKWKPMLEELDVRNQQIYKTSLLLHKSWVKSVISDLESKINSWADPSGDWIKNPFLWIWAGLIIYSYMNIEEDKKPLVIGVYSVLLLLSVWVNSSKIGDKRKEHQSDIDNLELLKNYLGSLD